jgi:hypothetical protein
MLLAGRKWTKTAGAETGEATPALEAGPLAAVTAPAQDSVTHLGLAPGAVPVAAAAGFPPAVPELRADCQAALPAEAPRAAHPVEFPVRRCSWSMAPFQVASVVSKLSAMTFDSGPPTVSIEESQCRRQVVIVT